MGNSGYNIQPGNVSETTLNSLLDSTLDTLNDVYVTVGRINSNLYGYTGAELSDSAECPREPDNIASKLRVIQNLSNHLKSELNDIVKGIS